MVPIRYIGKKAEFIDNLYGSGARWKHGSVVEVEPWAASRLLTHAEFQDARPRKERGEIVAPKPIPQVEQVDLPPLQTLETMTKGDITSFVRRHFGIELDSGNKKSALIEKAQQLMQRTRR